MLRHTEDTKKDTGKDDTRQDRVDNAEDDVNEDDEKFSESSFQVFIDQSFSLSSLNPNVSTNYKTCFDVVFNCLSFLLL